MSRIVRSSALALLALCLRGQSPNQPLTLADCIRLAASAPSPAGIARQQAEIARYATVQARAGFLPQAGLGTVLTYNSPLPYDRGTFSYVALNGIREYSTLASFGLELDTSGRLRAQLARARADQDAAGANLRLSERDLKRAVSAAYYRALLARRLVEAARGNLSEAQAFDARSRLLATQGEVAEADRIKASAQVAFFAQAVNAAELDSKLADHDLAAFWTADVDRPLALADPLGGALPAPEEPPPGEPFLRRPEFNLLDAARRGFEADARRARADLLPQVSLITQYGVDSTRFTLADRGYAGFIHLSVPIFDWFRARSAARQFDLEAAQVVARRAMAERQFSKEYRDALARVQMFYGQIAFTEQQVRLSEDNLRLSRVRYDGGEGSALDVVSAQNQLAQARANFFTAKANYLNARADLEVSEGK